jgi:hypothetical protein
MLQSPDRLARPFAPSRFRGHGAATLQPPAVPFTACCNQTLKQPLHLARAEHFISKNITNQELHLQTQIQTQLQVIDRWERSNDIERKLTFPIEYVNPLFLLPLPPAGTPNIFLNLELNLRFGWLQGSVSMQDKHKRHDDGRITVCLSHR